MKEIYIKPLNLLCKEKLPRSSSRHTFQMIFKSFVRKITEVKTSVHCSNLQRFLAVLASHSVLVSLKSVSESYEVPSDCDNMAENILAEVDSDTASLQGKKIVYFPLFNFFLWDVTLSNQS